MTEQNADYLPVGEDEFGPMVEGYDGLRLRYNGVWYFHARRAGKPTKKSFKTGDLDEAKTKWQAFTGTTPLPTKATRVHAAWDIYIKEPPRRYAKTRRGTGTRKTYGSAWNMDIEPVIGTKYVHEVDEDDILQIFELASARVSEHTKELLGPAALFGIRTALTSFFTWTTQVPHKYRDTHPVKTIDPELLPAKPEPKIVEDDEHVALDGEVELLAKVFENPKRNRSDSVIAAKQMRCLILISPELATRISETLALELDNYKKPLQLVGGKAKPARMHIDKQVNEDRDVTKRETWFTWLKGSHGSPNTKRRIVGLSPFAQDILDAYIADGLREGWLQEGGLLFPTVKQTPRLAGWAQGQLRWALKQAGLEKRIVSHYFRHAWASKALDAGHDLAFIADFLGNTERVAGETYAKRVNRDEHDAKGASVGRQ